MTSKMPPPSVLARYAPSQELDQLAKRIAAERGEIVTAETYAELALDHEYVPEFAEPNDE